MTHAHTLIVLLSDGLEEVQPAARGYFAPVNHIIYCTQCGQTWGRVLTKTADGRRFRYAPADAICADCGNGSLLQIRPFWTRDDWGIKVVQRELELATKEA